MGNKLFYTVSSMAIFAVSAWVAPLHAADTNVPSTSDKTTVQKTDKPVFDDNGRAAPFAVQDSKTNANFNDNGTVNKSNDDGNVKSNDPSVISKSSDTECPYRSTSP